VEKTAYVLFGGVGGGKSTLGKSLSSQGIRVLSTDRYIYEEDHAVRTGVDFNGRDAFKKAVAEASESIALDIMVTTKDLRYLEQQGFQIHALHLDIPDEKRKERLRSRKEEIDGYKQGLADILGLDPNKVEIRSRSLWRDPTLYERTGISYDQLEPLLVNAYTLGAEEYDERSPDPNDFYTSKIKYVTRFDHEDNLSRVSLDQIHSTRIPFQRYLHERAGDSAEVCIWDIGGVVYEYSLDRFFNELRARSQLSPAEFSARKISFDALMTASMSFEEFCAYVESRLEISGGNLEDILLEALRSGVSEPFSETIAIMEKLAARGVRNALLSNALPFLGEPKLPQSLIPNSDRFLSFNTGYLKPDPRAYLSSCGALGVDPSKALFVDDKRTNVQAATAVGMGAVVFRGPTQIAGDLQRMFPATCARLKF